MLLTWLAARPALAAAAEAGLRGLQLDGPHACVTLLAPQSYVVAVQAATACNPGCNRMQGRLQLYVGTPPRSS